jgi:predicted nucleic acid-binding protein
MSAALLLGRIATYRVNARPLLRIEMRALLLKLERRNGITPIETREALRLIEGLGVSWAGEPKDAALNHVLGFGRQVGLSMYDAIYLDLAMRENAVLASRDGPLLAAAAQQGLTIEDCR